MLKCWENKAFNPLSTSTTLYIHVSPIAAGQECKLSCIAEVGIRQFAKFSFGYVSDGTRCDDYDDNSGLCINGKCQVLCSVQLHLNPVVTLSYEGSCVWRRLNTFPSR